MQEYGSARPAALRLCHPPRRHGARRPHPRGRPLLRRPCPGQLSAHDNPSCYATCSLAITWHLLRLGWRSAAGHLQLPGHHHTSLSLGCRAPLSWGRIYYTMSGLPFWVMWMESERIATQQQALLTLGERNNTPTSPCLLITTFLPPQSSDPKGQTVYGVRDRCCFLPGKPCNPRDG